MRPFAWWIPLLVPICLSQSQAQTAIQNTPVAYSTWGTPSDEALGAHWDLTPEDVKRYNAYMAVEGRYFYPQVDPVMVLGLIETDPDRRAQFAAKYLTAERRRIEQQTGFATLAAEVQLKRFGLEKLVDFATVPGARQSPDYLAARAQRSEGRNGAFSSVAASTRPSPALPGASVAASTPARPALDPSAEPATPQAGDDVDLLVEAGCTTACYAKLTDLLKTPVSRIHIYGRGFKDNHAFIRWLNQRPGDAALHAQEEKRIEPRRFDALMFGDLATSKAPVALLRRHGVLVARL